MNMRSYELMTIYNIELGESGAKGVSEEVKGMITSRGGEVVAEHFWGKRKFAYKVAGNEQGYYDVNEFDIDPSQIAGLQRELELHKDVVRYLVTSLEE
ncbi:30S ribosomal protein S6 [candidate division WWE3 bacterium]|nr:30S ribosomal protein S6 [candidate division WWE3 bacterium]